MGLRERIGRIIRGGRKKVVKPTPKERGKPVFIEGEKAPPGAIVVSRTQPITKGIPTKPAIPTPTRRVGTGRPSVTPTTTGGQSRPGGQVIVTPKGKVVRTAIISRKPKPKQDVRLFTPLPEKDILTPKQRRKIVAKEKVLKFGREKLRVTLGKPRVTKKKIVQAIGFRRFEDEAASEETRLENEINNFAQSRKNFYQVRVNEGSISVNDANKKLNEDIDKRFNENINRSEFFRSKDPRRSTTNSISFRYETERLKALKEKDQKKADTLLFLEVVTDTPTGLVRFGGDMVKGFNKLVNDPEARETSTRNIKEVFKKENLKTLPSRIEVKATELKNFVQTSPGTALAIVGGSLVGFGLVIKAGVPVLSVTGVISKKVSKDVIKRLKFKPLVASGLKDIGNISIQLSPKVFKKTLKATGTGRALAISKNASKRFAKSFNEAIAKSKIGSRSRKIRKASKKLSREQIRIRKRRLSKKINRLKFVVNVKKKVRKVAAAKEKRRIRKNILRQREIRKKRRKELRRRLKKEAAAKKFKASKVGKGIKKVKRIPKRIKGKILKSRVSVKIKKVSKRLKIKREKSIERKRTIKRRKEREKRQATLLRKERFRKSKVGRLKARVSKKIKRLDNIIKKFETPTAKLLKSKRKTPLSKTFQREVKFKINEGAVKKFVRKQVKARGFNFDKLNKADQNFLIGQVKARIRNNPEKFLSKINKLAIQRIKGKKTKRPGKLKIKLRSGGEIVVSRIKPPKPSREVSARPGRQILLQKPKLKRPKQFITEVQIRPSELTKTQKIGLRKFRGLQTKQKLVQKQISVLKQKQARPKKKLRIKQKAKPRSKQLKKLMARSLLLSKQASKQKQKLRLKPRQKLALRPRQAQRITPRVLQGLTPRQAQKLRTKLKITPGLVKTAVAVPGILGKLTRKGAKRLRKAVTPGFDVFAKSRGKIIKLNKKPLSKKDAESRGAFAIDHSTARTLNIKAAKSRPKTLGKITKKERNYITKVKHKLRPFKIKKGKRIGLDKKLIEKRKFLIDTRGEKRGLSLSRLAKREGWIGKRQTPKRSNVKRSSVKQNDINKRMAKVRAAKRKK